MTTKKKFPAHIADNPSQITAVRFYADQLDKLQRHADKLGVTRSDLIRYYMDVALGLHRATPMSAHLDKLLGRRAPKQRTKTGKTTRKTGRAA